MSSGTLDLDDGLWLTITELAAEKGVSKPTISVKVKNLVADGRLTIRDGDRGTKLVNLAQFDRAVGDTGDAVKEGVAQTKAEADDADRDPALRDHQSRTARYAADLKYLDLEERLGRVVPVADVAEAAQRAAEVIVRALDRLPTHAEAVAVAVGKDGPVGARGALKEIAREIRQSIAEAMGVLAGSAVPLTIEPDAAPAQ